MNRIVILAHTAYQAERFAKKNYLRRSDILYATRPDILDGICNCVVIYLSGWVAHRDNDRIDERVQIVRVGYGIERLFVADDTFLLYDVATQQLQSPEGDPVSCSSETMQEFLRLLSDRFHARLQDLVKR